MLEGQPFGAPVAAAGEVVFNTGMVGYPESLTDPSYAGQILVLTYPLVGNYGVPAVDLDGYGLPAGFESERIQAAGLVVWEHCRALQPPQRDRAASTPGCAEEGVPGARRRRHPGLTKLLRSRGTMLGALEIGGCDDRRPVRPQRGRHRRHRHLQWGDDLPPGGDRPPAPAPPGARGLRRQGQHPAQPSGARLRRRAGPLRPLLPRPRPSTASSSPTVPATPRCACRPSATSSAPWRSAARSWASAWATSSWRWPPARDTYKLPFGHRSQNQPCVEVAATGSATAAA